MRESVARVAVQLDDALRCEVSAAFNDGSALGRLIATKLKLHDAHFIAPPDLVVPPTMALKQLRSGGLTAGNGRAVSIMRWLAEETSNYLSEANDSSCIIENRYARKGDPSLARLKGGTVTVLAEDVLHILVGPISSDGLLDAIKKGTTLPHAAIFWVDRRIEAGVSIDASDLAAACNRAFLLICDGEAYLEFAAR